MKASLKIHRFFLIYGFWAAVLVGFLIGGLSSWRFFSGQIWIILALTAGGVGLVISRRFCMFLMIAAGVLVGLNRMSNFNLQKHHFSKSINTTQEVSGIITEDLDRKEDGSATIRLKIDRINRQPASGNLLITTRKIEARRSDQLTVRGKISAGFGSFSGTMFRANVVKITPKSEPVRDVRDWFSAKIRQFIGSPEVDLGLGYLLGQKNSLPENLDQALRITALSHIVVASGYNLTVLVRFCRRIFAKYSKKLAAF